jgi:hypothetical protein
MTAAALLDRLRDSGIDIWQSRDGWNRCACPKCDKGPKDDALAVRIAFDRAVWTCHRCAWSAQCSLTAAGNAKYGACCGQRGDRVTRCALCARSCANASCF